MQFMQDYETIVAHLNRQRRALGMGIDVVARRSGVSKPTVQRILAGNQPHASFDHVCAIARALGAVIGVARMNDARDMRREQATRAIMKKAGLSPTDTDVTDIPDEVKKLIVEGAEILQKKQNMKLWKD